MNSIGEECLELKKQYDSCFNSWFSESFLRGKNDDSMCSNLLKVYQQCVKQAIKAQNIDVKDVETDHLGGERELKTPKKEEKS